MNLLITDDDNNEVTCNLGAAARREDTHCLVGVKQCGRK